MGLYRMFLFSFQDGVKLVLMLISSTVDSSQVISSKFEFCKSRLVYNVMITQGNSPISNSDQAQVTLDLATTHVLYCLYQKCNTTEGSTVKWVIPDQVPYVSNDHTKFGAFLSSNMSYLTLKSIQVSFKGVYQCFVETPSGICHVINFLVDVTDGSRLGIKHRLLIGLISCVFTVLLLFLGRKIYILYYSKETRFLVSPKESLIESTQDINSNGVKKQQSLIDLERF